MSRLNANLLTEGYETYERKGKTESNRKNFRW